MAKKYSKIDFNDCGIGVIDGNGFYIIKKKPYRPPIYALKKKYSTWLVKLKLKYPRKKRKRSNRMTRMTIREYANKHLNNL